jgi:hypothetical protein
VSKRGGGGGIPRRHDSHMMLGVVVFLMSVGFPGDWCVACVRGIRF